LIFNLNCSCQDSFNSSGTDFNSNSGSISFSVGQVNYTTSENNYGTVNSGVQQSYIISSTGIINSTNEISIYPNPTTENLILETNLNEHIEFNIFNINGQKILAGKSNGFKTTINTENLSHGTYLLKVFSNENINQNFKIIKK
jgi:hypothetical protein